MTPLLMEVRRYTERRWFLGTKQESNRLCCGMTNPELRWEVAMPLLAADPVIVLPEQREVLEQLVRAHSTPQQVGHAGAYGAQPQGSVDRSHQRAQPVAADTSTGDTPPLRRPSMSCDVMRSCQSAACGA